MSKMRSSGISVDDIINTRFFQEQMRIYGWDELNSHSVVLFGGQGEYEFNYTQ
jgi:hypothetical protein